jgi:hypothetical protein
MANANNDGMGTWGEIHQKLDEAVKFISGKVSFKPEIGIILGTGLGSLVDGMKTSRTSRLRQSSRIMASSCSVRFVAEK